VSANYNQGIYEITSGVQKVLQHNKLVKISPSENNQILLSYCLLKMMMAWYVWHHCEYLSKLWNL